jgi:diacylglycerol kinase (ATP)
MLNPGRMEKEFQKRGFSLTSRLKSFKPALHGIGILLKYEHNSRIHLFILVMVIVAGILFKISAADWLAIILVSGFVFASECFNTAIECLSDMITGELNENIRRAKDVASAGVLIAAAVSVITGFIIFIPEIIKLL